MLRNELVPTRVVMEKECASRVNPRVLPWFGHAERMNEQLMAKK